MTHQARVEAVQAFGFLPRQARFLVTVLLHGGYCLRRHYTAFTGTRKGKNVQAFLEGLVARRLASRLTFRRDRGHVYHVDAHALYRAIGHEENRNRRLVATARMARKLMLLDVVVQQPEATWIATESDKIACFTERFHVPLADLPRRTLLATGTRPQTTRYFMDKLPIALVGDPPVVQVVFLATEVSPVPFERFLREHARLLSAVPAWVVLVAHPGRLASAASVWETAFQRFVTGDGGVTDACLRDLERYFVVRLAVERNELARVSIADLQTFRARRAAFAEPAIEALFGRWIASGEARLDPALVRGPALGVGRLVVQPLAHTYEQFGAYAGLV